jgi:hypothetical protein
LSAPIRSSPFLLFFGALVLPAQTISGGAAKPKREKMEITDLKANRVQKFLSPGF